MGSIVDKKFTLDLLQNPNKFEQGNRFWLYKCNHDSPTGEDLVRDVVRAHADETPEQIINQVMTLVDLHQGDRSPADDQTLVAVRIV